MVYFDPKGVFGRSLLIAGIVFGSAVIASAASAAECPPGHKKADVRPAPSDKIWDGAHLATDGIVDETIATVEIDEEPFNIKDRVFRMRTLTVEPGAVVPWHSHADRPAIMYVLKGELTEYASNCDVPVTYKPGDYVAETVDLSHWWQNLGDETVMLVSADLLKEEGKE
jgi:quercetin dioxygenase-like cupin family protein